MFQRDYQCFAAEKKINFDKMVSTIRFLVCSLTRMNISVFLHVTLLMESLPAVLARIGPCVRVDEKVCGEGRRTL